MTSQCQIKQNRLHTTVLSMLALVLSFCIAVCAVTTVIPSLSEKESFIYLGERRAISSQACEVSGYQVGEEDTYTVDSQDPYILIQKVPSSAQYMLIKIKTAAEKSIPIQVFYGNNLNFKESNSVKASIARGKDYAIIRGIDPTHAKKLRVDIDGNFQLQSIAVSSKPILSVMQASRSTIIISTFLIAVAFCACWLALMLYTKKKKLNWQLVYSLLFLAGYALLLTMWCFRQPYDRGPDEAMRYQIPEFIFNNHHLPTLFDDSIRNPIWGFSYAAQPDLPYLVQTLFMKAFYALGIVHLSNLYLAARFANIVAGVAYAAVVIAIAKKVFNTNGEKLAFTAVATLWPQLCFVFTYVNCDAIAMLGTALVIVAWLDGLKYQWRARDCVVLVIGMVTLMLSYLNTYSFILMSIILFALSFVSYENGKWHLRFVDMMKRGIPIAVATLALGGWFFLRNFKLYGSLLGSNITAQQTLQYGSPEVAPEVRAQFAHEMLSTPSGIFTWIRSTMFSFFGNFGYMDTFFDWNKYHVIYTIVAIVLLFALVYFLRNAKKADRNTRLFMIGCLGASAITIALSFIYSFSDYQAQGRYIMPMMIPFALCMTYGIKNVFEKKPSIDVLLSGIAALGALGVTDIYVILYMIH